MIFNVYANVKWSTPFFDFIMAWLYTTIYVEFLTTSLCSANLLKRGGLFLIFLNGSTDTRIMIDWALCE